MLAAKGSILISFSIRAECMRKINLYIASSLDSYIAGENGSIDWLFSDGEIMDMQSFMIL